MTRSCRSSAIGHAVLGPPDDMSCCKCAYSIKKDVCAACKGFLLTKRWTWTNRRLMMQCAQHQSCIPRAQSSQTRPSTCCPDSCQIKLTCVLECQAMRQQVWQCRRCWCKGRKKSSAKAAADWAQVLPAAQVHQISPFHKLILSVLSLHCTPARQCN